MVSLSLSRSLSPSILEYELNRGTFALVKLSEPIDTVLPKSLELALKFSAPNRIVRAAAISLFGTLLGYTDGHCMRRFFLPPAWTSAEIALDTYGAAYENLLGQTGASKLFSHVTPKSQYSLVGDTHVIARVTEIAVKDSDLNCRQDAIQLLKATYQHNRRRFLPLRFLFPSWFLPFIVFRWQDPIKMTLPKVLDNALKGQDAALRDNAIFATYTLSTPKTSEMVNIILRISNFSQYFALK